MLQEQTVLIFPMFASCFMLLSMLCRFRCSTCGSVGHAFIVSWFAGFQGPCPFMVCVFHVFKWFAAFYGFYVFMLLVGLWVSLCACCHVLLLSNVLVVYAVSIQLFVFCFCRLLWLSIWFPCSVSSQRRASEWASERASQGGRERERVTQRGRENKEESELRPTCPFDALWWPAR